MRTFLWLAVVSALVPLSIGALFAGKSDVNMTQLHIETFWMVGLTARTSNSKEMSGDGEIPQLWKRLYQDSVLSRIPNRVDTQVIAVYSDYESDKDGAYTYTLGARVKSGDHVPAGLIARKVAAGEYGIFTAEGGPIPQLVVGLWKQIWSLEAGPVHRAYRTDFEVYEEGQNPQNGRVDVYIGLKK